MIEKIAQDILDRTNIKLAGLSDLFEKIAGNMYGITPNNFQLNMIGNPQLHGHIMQNISSGKVPISQVQNFFNYMNHPNNGAFKANATKSGLYSTVNNFLLNANQGSKPANAAGVAARQQFNAQNLQRVLRNSARIR